MARLAVFASGRGSNFVAIAERIRSEGRHSLELLVCDQPGAPAIQRARELGVPARVVPYTGRSRQAAEAVMLAYLGHYRVQLVALAGFMRLLTPFFLGGFCGEVLNLHPSLLPKYPGAHGIEESYRSGDRELGITVIRVDEGCDTGPVIAQRSFHRAGGESLSEVEERIHRLEHQLFPSVVVGVLDALDERGGSP